MTCNESWSAKNGKTIFEAHKKPHSNTHIRIDPHNSHLRNVTRTVSSVLTHRMNNNNNKKNSVSLTMNSFRLRLHIKLPATEHGIKKVKRKERVGERVVERDHKKKILYNIGRNTQKSGCIFYHMKCASERERDRESEKCFSHYTF